MNVTSISLQNKTSSFIFEECEERNLQLRTIMYTILLVCVFIIGIISNGLAVIVIFLSRSLRKHPTNLLVASLNLCDIGVILCSIPIRLDGFLYGQFCFNIHVCRFFNMTDLLFHISSISHLFIIAIERYIAVRLPFYHRYDLDTKLITKVIAATWTYSIIWTGVGMFDWNDLSREATLITTGPQRQCVLQNRTYHIVVYTVIYLTPLTIMAVLYTLILRSAFAYSERMSDIAVHSQNLNTGADKTKSRTNKQERNISRTVFIIYGAFVICWLPVTLITIIYQTCPQCFTEFLLNYPTLSDATFTTFVIVLPAIHSCLNPFIYMILCQSFQTAIRELIGRRLNYTSSLTSYKSGVYRSKQERTTIL